MKGDHLNTLLIHINHICSPCQPSRPGSHQLHWNGSPLQPCLLWALKSNWVEATIFFWGGDFTIYLYRCFGGFGGSWILEKRSNRFSQSMFWTDAKVLDQCGEAPGDRLYHSVGGGFLGECLEI